MGSDDCFRVSATAPTEGDHQTLDWTLALAGGEGTRLQDYARRRFGYQLPKQYCPLLGSRSTLQQTLMRLNHLTPASRTLTVIGPTMRRTRCRNWLARRTMGFANQRRVAPGSRSTSRLR